MMRCHLYAFVAHAPSTCLDSRSTLPFKLHRHWVPGLLPSRNRFHLPVTSMVLATAVCSTPSMAWLSGVPSSMPFREHSAIDLTYLPNRGALSSFPAVFHLMARMHRSLGLPRLTFPAACGGPLRPVPIAGLSNSRGSSADATSSKARPISSIGPPSQR